jgi:membrane protein implicated in regulation of membrane protease activity
VRHVPRTFWSYLLLQIPDTVLAIVVLSVLHEWAGLSTRWALALLILWTLKNLLVYPLVREAFAPSRATGLEALLGRSASVVETLAPRGRVRVGGELWWAEIPSQAEVVPQGSTVIVRGRRGLTLLVEAEATGPPPAQVVGAEDGEVLGDVRGGDLRPIPKVRDVTLGLVEQRHDPQARGMGQDTE